MLNHEGLITYTILWKVASNMEAVSLLETFLKERFKFTKHLSRKYSFHISPTPAHGLYIVISQFVNMDNENVIYISRFKTSK